LKISLNNCIITDISSFFVFDLKNKIFILLFYISTTGFSQVGGENIFNFLNASTSAKQSALGGETLTLINDVDQALWNPSLINEEIDNQASLNYVDFLVDVNFGSASFAHAFDRRIGTLHAGVTYVNYGSFIAANEDGTETGTFQARDLAFQVGYGYSLPWNGFRVGANLKFISSAIENYTSSGIAADIGLTYYNEFKPYMFTAVIRNVGYQIDAFDQVKEKLPLEIAVGASYKLENVPLQWHLTINNLQQWNVSSLNPSDSQSTIDGETTNEKIGFVGNAFRHVVVGAEFFPDKGFNIRLGYNFRRARELRLTETRTFAGLTTGFGLKMKRIKFNYAYSIFHPTTNINTFSININLAKSGLKKY